MSYSTLGSQRSSLAFKVVIYFARNPHEELTSDDIVKRWDWENRTCVSTMLRKYRSEGILTAEVAPDRCINGAKLITWSAGPALLELIK